MFHVPRGGGHLVLVPREGRDGDALGPFLLLVGLGQVEQGVVGTLFLQVPQVVVLVMLHVD